MRAWGGRRAAEFDGAAVARQHEGVYPQHHAQAVESDAEEVYLMCVSAQQGSSRSKFWPGFGASR